MFKFVLISSLLLVAVLAAPQNIHNDADEEQQALERQQNESAKYEFDSRIDDGINGGKSTREEKRDGSKVKGMYSYDDGYVRRVVHYEADENGYRVVKEEMENIGDGPAFNPEGQADVEGSLIGEYSIKLDHDDEKHYKDARQ